MPNNDAQRHVTSKGGMINKIVLLFFNNTSGNFFIITFLIFHIIILKCNQVRKSKLTTWSSTAQVKINIKIYYFMRARSTRQHFSHDNSIKYLCAILSFSFLFTLQHNAIFNMHKIKIIHYVIIPQ